MSLPLEGEGSMHDVAHRVTSSSTTSSPSPGAESSTKADKKESEAEASNISSEPSAAYENTGDLSSDQGVADFNVAKDTQTSEQSKSVAGGPAPSRGQPATGQNFPQKLMAVLSDEENSHAIEWMPDGMSFAIVNPKAFISDVIPKFFKHTKFASVTRKLNRWGFKRISAGESSGAYYHAFFRRDEPELCSRMRCQKPGNSRRIDTGRLGDDAGMPRGSKRRRESAPLDTQYIAPTPFSMMNVPGHHQLAFPSAAMLQPSVASHPHLFAPGHLFHPQLQPAMLSNAALMPGNAGMMQMMQEQNADEGLTLQPSYPPILQQQQQQQTQMMQQLAGQMPGLPAGFGPVRTVSSQNTQQLSEREQQSVSLTSGLQDFSNDRVDSLGADSNVVGGSMTSGTPLFNDQNQFLQQSSQLQWLQMQQQQQQNALPIPRFATNPNFSESARTGSFRGLEDAGMNAQDSSADD